MSKFMPVLHADNGREIIKREIYESSRGLMPLSSNNVLRSNHCAPTVAEPT